MKKENSVLLEIKNSLYTDNIDSKRTVVFFDGNNPNHYIRVSQEPSKTGECETRCFAKYDDGITEVVTVEQAALESYAYEKRMHLEQNFASVLRLLRMLTISEEDENHEADLDILFKKLEAEDPENIAVKSYKDFKAAAGKTSKSIVTQVNSRLAPFNLEKVENLTHKDTLELEKIPEEKTAFFIIIPDSDKTFHFLAAMLYYQMFDLFSKMAFQSKGKRFI